LDKSNLTQAQVLRISALSAFVCALLLSPSAISADLDRDFISAIQNKDFAALHHLVASGIDVNQSLDDGRTALMAAAKHGDSRLVRKLLAKGADVSIANANGGTALMFCATNADLGIAKVLLEHRSSVNAQARNGWTAIMIASAKGNHQLVQLLLEHGADANIEDVYGWTPLIRAAYEGRRKAVAALLEWTSININAQDEQGATALHHAAAKGYEQIVGLLVGRGADTTIKDKSDTTAAMAAEVGNHVGVKEAIKLATDGG